MKHIFAPLLGVLLILVVSGCTQPIGQPKTNENAPAQQTPTYRSGVTMDELLGTGVMNIEGSYPTEASQSSSTPPAGCKTVKTFVWKKTATTNKAVFSVVECYNEGAANNLLGTIENGMTTAIIQDVYVDGVKMIAASSTEPGHDGEVVYAWAEGRFMIMVSGETDALARQIVESLLSSYITKTSVASEL